MDNLGIIAFGVLWYAFGAVSYVYWFRRAFPEDRMDAVDIGVGILGAIAGPVVWVTLWLEYRISTRERI